MGVVDTCKNAAAKCNAVPDKIKSAISDTLQQVTGDTGNNMKNAAAGLVDPNLAFTYWSTADEDNFLRNYYKSERRRLTNKAKKNTTQMGQMFDVNRKMELTVEKYGIFGNPENCSKIECPTQQGKDMIDEKLSLYTTNLYKHFSGTADEIQKNAKIQHENYMRELTTLITQYKSQEAYSKRMQELLSTKKKEKSDLEDELHKSDKDQNIDSRKAVYETAERDSLKSTRKVMFYIYYIVFVLYLIFGNYFKDKEYRNIKVWILMALYLTLPYYIYYITNGIRHLYNKFIYVKDNKLPKNVYTDLYDN